MRILVVTPLYMPGGGPSAPLYTMLCQGLARRGHQVTVLASVPHYPTGRVQAEFRGRGITRSREELVEVVRVPLPSVERSRLSLRLLQFVLYQLQAAWVGLSQRYDVVLASNPALEVGLPFALLSALHAMTLGASDTDSHGSGPLLGTPDRSRGVRSGADSVRRAGVVWGSGWRDHREIGPLFEVLCCS